MYPFLPRVSHFTRTLARSFSTLRLSLQELRNRNAPVDIHPEVEEALAHRKPVVAMETALVTHGMQYPTNLTIATELESIVKSMGAVPATIGIVKGRVKIGLERPELERLAERGNTPVKVSRRDIAAAIATKADGGTTISATIIFSALAGIKVFATGGLGGVHRGGESSLDISADLHELARLPVGVVSAGAKSILDLGRTLEYLETLGVPVISYGESREFPAFFTRQSGFEVPWNVSDPETAARILHAQWQLGLNNGALIAVPIPRKCEADGEIVQQCIEQAVAESEANGISKKGKEATPWLLNRVNQLSKGASLAANLDLIRNTTSVGTQIAIKYQNILNEHADTDSQLALTSGNLSKCNLESAPALDACTTTFPPAEVVVVGCAALDITSQATTDQDPALIISSTVPGAVTFTSGGVARNIAEATHRTLSAVSSTLSSVLIAPVGNDPFGRLLIDQIEKVGMRTDGLIRMKHRTAVCNMVLDSHGDLTGGVADMNITAELSSAEIISQVKKYKPGFVVMDGNLSADAIKETVAFCLTDNIKGIEPTSTIKSTKIMPAIASALKTEPDRVPIDFISPNLLELAHLYAQAKSNFDIMSYPAWWRKVDNLSLGSAFRMDLEQLTKREVSDQDPAKGSLAFLLDKGVAQMAINLLPLFKSLIIKCGTHGVLVVLSLSGNCASTSQWTHEQSNLHKRYVVAHGKSDEVVVLQHFPPQHMDKVVNVTGAGDSFVGSVLATLVRDASAFRSPRTLDALILAAQRAAVLSLGSTSAVAPLLSVKQG